MRRGKRCWVRTTHAAPSLGFMVEAAHPGKSGDLASDPPGLVSSPRLGSLLCFSRVLSGAMLESGFG